jgi:vacuolar protein-sorting-associated protein 4
VMLIVDNALKSFDTACKYSTRESRKKQFEEKSQETNALLQSMKDKTRNVQVTPSSQNIKKKQTTETSTSSNSSSQNATNTKNKSQSLIEDELLIENAIITHDTKVSWDSIAGLRSAKETLQEAVLLPKKFPEMFTNRQPWKGILLYGPPGTGKTHLARAVASDLSSTFISVSPSGIMSKWQGESEKYVKAMFNVARSRDSAVIFIDEIDSIAQSRSEQESDSIKRIKCELFMQMDGLTSDKSAGKVLVMAATNLPWTLDEAFQRRFEKRVYIPLPDVQARTSLIKIKMTENDVKHTMSETDFETISNKLDGFSGSDINNLIKSIMYEPIRRYTNSTHFVYDETTKVYTPCDSSVEGAIVKSWKDLESEQMKLEHVCLDDFLKVLPKCKPSVSRSGLKKFEEFTFESGENGSI